jgi:hypothetical protein
MALAPGIANAADVPTFDTERLPVQHVGSGTEPRVAVGPDDRRWVATTDGEQGGPVVVFSSPDGHVWSKTAGDVGGQTVPTIDVDIVALPTGRIIASELDTAGLNFPTGYSDDGGKTWTASTGTTAADQDRQWFAVGKVDPSTKQPRVYLLFHNLASGLAQHNMWVQTSHDGGATFGAPVPVTTPTPGNQDAYLDLQCGDSGGPSTIMADQRTGKVYVVFTTRAAPQNGGIDVGGCGASVFGPIEVNVVAGTRVWVGQADADAQSFSDSLAVDHAADGHIVSMQLAYGALDRAGNVYVAYPESPRPYPDFSQAAVRYVFSAPGDTLKWSQPRTVLPNGPDGSGGGHQLVHMVAGDPGQLSFAYFTGVPQSTGKPAWFLEHSQTQDGFDQAPDFVHQRVSDVKTYRYTAAEMMAACSEPDDPAQGIENGFECNRSTDVWGIAADQECRTVIAWPTGTKDQPDEAPGKLGTYVSTQTGGPTLCDSSAATSTPVPTGGGTPQQPGGISTSACPDKIAPVSRTGRTKLRVGKTRLRVSGTSRDKGCKSTNTITGAGHVARVDVSIAKVRGKSLVHCRFLKANGKLTGNRRCRKPVLLPAKGLERWSLRFAAKLPRGSYRLVVRAVDRARNKEKPAKGRNIVSFRVR